MKNEKGNELELIDMLIPGNKIEKIEEHIPYDEKNISENDVKKLKTFMDNPLNESWMVS